MLDAGECRAGGGWGKADAVESTDLDEQHTTLAEILCLQPGPPGQFHKHKAVQKKQGLGNPARMFLSIEYGTHVPLRRLRAAQTRRTS